MTRPLSIEEALSRILSGVSVLPTETIPVRKSLGRVLAADLGAPRNMPDLPRSAVDGFAVQSDQGPVFDVVMEVRAGILPKDALKPGQAAAIMTGAVVPQGADCLVMVEDCHLEGPTLTTPENLKPGDMINPVGDEISAGDVFVGKGTLIGPSVFPALFCAGLTEVPVYRTARVGLLVSGDEVREIEDGPAPGQVFNTNRYIIEAVCAGLGVEIVETSRVVDDEQQTRELLRKMEERCDMIITSGGVSKGRYDHLGTILRSDHYSLIVQGTAIKPGRPLHVAKGPGGTLIFGMPGYPSALLTNAFLYLVPALKKTTGRSDFQTRWIRAILKDPQRGRPGKSYFNRVKLEHSESGIMAVDPGSQMSSHFLNFARCSGLVRMPSEGPTADHKGPFTLEAGTMVDALDFGWELS